MPRELLEHSLMFCEPQHLLYGHSQVCHELRNIIDYSVGKMQHHMWNVDKYIAQGRATDRYLVTYGYEGRPPSVNFKGELPEGVRLLKPNEFPEPEQTEQPKDQDALENDEPPNPELSKEPSKGKCKNPDLAAHEEVLIGRKRNPLVVYFGERHGLSPSRRGTIS
jgi:hypothetical protein